MDQKTKALARQLQAWIRGDLLVLRKERPIEVIFYGKKFTTLSTEASIAAKNYLMLPIHS